MQVYNSKKNPWEFFPVGIGAIPVYIHSRSFLFPLPLGIAFPRSSVMQCMRCDVVSQRATSTARARVLSKAPPNVTPTVAPVDTRLTRLLTSAAQVYTQFVASAVFTCIGALGTPPPTERGPSLESIYRVSLTVLSEG